MVLSPYNCVCCSLNHEDDLAHLFLTCSFARDCWSTIGLQVTQDDPWSAFDSLKAQLEIPFFMEVIELVHMDAA